MARSVVAALALLVPVFAVACASEVERDEADATEDQLVASFDKTGKIDVAKTTHILLVGDSDELGELPLYAASTRARRYAQLYPNDQIVLFVTKDVSSSTVARTSATVVRQEPFGDAVALADLSRLTGPKLVAALDRFARIASIDFFGHSSPFGALLESSGDDRVLAPALPLNMAVLKDNFARDANPYVTFNGCNGAAHVAPELSRLWQLPVSGALTGSNFQELMSDGRWYFNDEGFSPPGMRKAAKNDRSFGPASAFVQYALWSSIAIVWGSA